jgi:hypothetical protein
MYKEVAELWAEALRSGRYPRTTSRLRSITGLCPLGVLCDLHAKQTGKGEWCLVNDGTYRHPNISMAYKAGGNIDDYIPPWAVWRWAGFSSTPPTPAVEYAYRTTSGEEIKRRVSVPELNDVFGVTFDVFASLIETQWESM